MRTADRDARLNPLGQPIGPALQGWQPPPPPARGRPANGSLEVGYLQLSPPLQRARASTEATCLMTGTVFELGYRRRERKCDALNAVSRRAAARFAFEGVLRQAAVRRGRSRDPAWYSVRDAQWPALARGFRAWLEPGNFDASGCQRRSLADCRGEP